MEKVKVVGRFSDGKLIKGFTQDFFPEYGAFHLIPGRFHGEEFAGKRGKGEQWLPGKIIVGI
jgi:hypothetical protein